MTVSFFVHGSPVAQGSHRAFSNPKNGRPIITTTAKGLGPWRRIIADAAQPHARMIEGPVAIKLTFLMPRPKSLPKTRHTPMTKRPDLDKLARAALDALTSVFFADDSQVVSLDVRKVYAQIGGPVGVEVCVWEQDLWLDETISRKWSAAAETRAV